MTYTFLKHDFCFEVTLFGQRTALASLCAHFNKDVCHFLECKH